MSEHVHHCRICCEMISIPDHQVLESEREALKVELNKVIVRLKAAEAICLIFKPYGPYELAALRVWHKATGK